MLRILTSTFCLFFGVLLFCNAESKLSNDPFAEPAPDPKLEIESTTSHFKITHFYEQVVDRIDYPDVIMPSSFNRLFKSPYKVWRTNGGFISSFDAGEFGAGLFYASTTDKQWVRLIDDHIQCLHAFAEDTFIAVGGLAHMDLAYGSAYIIKLTPEGTWSCKKVFHSSEGVPKIIGISAQDTWGYSHQETLCIISIAYPNKNNSIFGISKSGVTNYIGVPSKSP